MRRGLAALWLVSFACSCTADVDINPVDDLGDEVGSAADANGPTVIHAPTNLALNRPATASSVELAGLEAAKAFEQLGATIKDFYLVSGQYDAIVVTEAADDTTAAKASLALGSRGNVRTETFRAFTEEEFRKIVSALP